MCRAPPPTGHTHRWSAAGRWSRRWRRERAAWGTGPARRRYHTGPDGRPPAACADNRPGAFHSACRAAPQWCECAPCAGRGETHRHHRLYLGQEKGNEGGRLALRAVVVAETPHGLAQHKRARLGPVVRLDRRPPKNEARHRHALARRILLMKQVGQLGAAPRSKAECETPPVLGRMRVHAPHLLGAQ
jgi:hypothetical protein